MPTETRREHYLAGRLETALLVDHAERKRLMTPDPIYSEDCAPRPLRQGWHQWWCVGVPCSCLAEWVAYDEARRAGGNPVFPPTAIVEGPPCAACKGTGEQMEPSGARGPCALGEGQRHPKCRGNGGGRMSPAQLEGWLAEQTQAVEAAG